VVRGLPLWSHELGLVGKADVVEFRGEQPYPIEYKVGRRHRWGHEDIQVAAQAMCLEEMLATTVPMGAIFYRGSQRRREVAIDEALRALVRETVASVRSMLAGEELPAAVNDARCPSCSLFDACLPHVVARPHRMRLFQAELFRADSGPDPGLGTRGD
jgi:CRISPR-associated exonuclease Cas4